MDLPALGRDTLGGRMCVSWECKPVCQIPVRTVCIAPPIEPISPSLYSFDIVFSKRQLATPKCILVCWHALHLHDHPT